MNKEVHEKNAQIVGLIGEKIIANHLSSRAVIQIKFSLDPYDPYDLLVGEHDTIQVKCCTPFYREDYWSVHKTKTGNNIRNMLSADSIYLISLPCKNMKGFSYHESDSSILLVNPKKLTQEENVVGDQFVLRRTEHRDKYDIVRKLTDEEVKIFSKYPTSYFS